MKKRYLYMLLFGVPGLFVSLILAFFAFGVTAGLFWIYVFGDDAWPASTETALLTVFIVTFLTGWITAVVAGYRAGMKREGEPGIDRNHILLSAVATLIPVVLIVVHQRYVGNIGSESPTVRCSAYCRDQGYAASGMPPRNSGDTGCICYDVHGEEAVRVPMDSVTTRN